MHLAHGHIINIYSSQSNCVLIPLEQFRRPSKFRMRGLGFLCLGLQTEILSSVIKVGGCRLPAFGRELEALLLVNERIKNQFIVVLYILTIVSMHGVLERRCSTLVCLRN